MPARAGATAPPHLGERIAPDRERAFGLNCQGTRLIVVVSYDVIVAEEEIVCRFLCMYFMFCRGVGYRDS